MDWSVIGKHLTAKLDPANVKPAKSFGPKGDYIEGWHAIAEANRIFGFNGWSYDIPECTCVYQGPREIGQAKKPGFGVTYTAKVRVVVDGVAREDFGAGHGYDVDCGLAHESAIKEAITDALKRALRTFGNPFGLALYDKSRENVGRDEPRREPQPDPLEDMATFNATVDATVFAMDKQPDLKALAAFWETLPKAVKQDAKVAGAKEKRKAELQKEAA